MDRRQTRLSFITLVAVGVTVSGIYLAAYYGLVTQSFSIDRDQPVMSFIIVMATPEPSYRLGGTVSEVFFRPAHAVDRMFRPQTWRRQDLGADLPSRHPEQRE
jgi:hypothetical protein